MRSLNKIYPPTFLASDFHSHFFGEHPSAPVTWLSMSQIVARSSGWLKRPKRPCGVSSPELAPVPGLKTGPRPMSAIYKTVFLRNDAKVKETVEMKTFSLIFFGIPGIFLPDLISRLAFFPLDFSISSLEQFARRSERNEAGAKWDFYAD